MNAVEPQRKYCKINDLVLESPARNGLVAGSSPAGATKDIVAMFALSDRRAPSLSGLGWRSVANQPGYQ
jgi:hypothetical protein